MKIKITLLLLLSAIAVWSCKKDKSTLPEVETYTPEFVGSNAITIMCHVTSNGGSDFLECGIYVGDEADPESTGLKLMMGNDTGLWFGRLTGLSPETEYFLKAYALNGIGENLGDEVSITTTARVNDYDANIYETVKIGEKLWMAADLNTTHYLNGEAVETTTPGTLDISAEIEPAYHWVYEGGDVNKDEYGRLYTWYAVDDSRNVCPDGWHIPTDAEWTDLETYFGGYLYAGSYLKESGNIHWISPYNVDATNISGFTALPGGYRDATGVFELLRNEGYWWTATSSTTDKSWSRKIRASSSEVVRDGINKNWGLSVRCVKDN